MCCYALRILECTQIDPHNDRGRTERYPPNPGTGLLSQSRNICIRRNTSSLRKDGGIWSKMQACLVTLQEIPKPEEKLARLWALTAIMIQDLTTTSMRLVMSVVQLSSRIHRKISNQSMSRQLYRSPLRGSDMHFLRRNGPFN